MKFNEFPLYNAICDIYHRFEQTNLKPRSADWLIFKSKREELCSLVLDNIRTTNENFFLTLTETEEEILKAWDDFGKNKLKYKLLIAVARQYGNNCFYKFRNKGNCSQIMCLERIPGERNSPPTIENCVIVCKRHITDHK